MSARFRLVLLFVLGFGVVSRSAQASDIADFVELPQLTQDLARAITAAKLVDPEEPFFIIRKIELTLQGVQVGEGNVVFSIPVWVFEVDLETGGVLERREALELTLIPTPTALVGGDSLVDITPLLKILKEAFAQSRDLKLLAPSIKITRKWALQRAFEGGVDTIVLKVGAGISDEKAQSITFHLCQTQDLENCVPDGD